MRRALLLFASIILFTSVEATAQQWSPEQQEVWQAVNEMSNFFSSGDIEAAYEFIHPELIWWNTNEDVPGDYETAKKLDTAFAENGRKWLTRSCTPLTIQVFEGFAVVNGYCRGFRETEEGKDPEYKTLRLLNVMKKEGAKWLQVANFIDASRQ